jgi:signal peptidase II
LKQFFNRYGLLLGITSIILFIDQVSKAVVRERIPFGDSWMPLTWLAPYFRFVHWENTGAAFGMFQNGGAIFGILAVIVSTLLVVYYAQIPKEETLMRIAMSMQMAGAVGNLIDRIMFGPVTDFISVGTFPVFNIADSSITIGTGLLILGLLQHEQKLKRGDGQIEETISESPNPVDDQA